MVVFGGFNFGTRTNSIHLYNFKQNEWEMVQVQSTKNPCPRVGHSAVIRYDGEGGDCMYIFGGKDDENNKLNDVWKFNFDTLQWSPVRLSGDMSDEPLPRSGHAACIWNDNYMIIYGGIYEVTKELNDMYVFDLRQDKWVCLF